MNAKCCLCLVLPGALQLSQDYVTSSAEQVCWFGCSLEVLFSGASKSLCIHHSLKSVWTDWFLIHLCKLVTGTKEKILDPLDICAFLIFPLSSHLPSHSARTRNFGECACSSPPLFFFFLIFSCVIVPKGFKAAGMLMELNRKIKKILGKGCDLSPVC